MVTVVAPGTAPGRGRIAPILVLVTFVALCLAFFAGTIHQADSRADAHDTGAALTLLSPADSASEADDAVATPAGPLGALATTCALFVLTVLTLAAASVGGRRRVLTLNGARRPLPQSPPLPVHAGRPILLESSISRT